MQPVQNIQQAVDQLKKVLGSIGPVIGQIGLEPQPLRVRLTREPMMGWFTLSYHSAGKDMSEDLEPEETRDWFRERGANMDVVEKALDYVWNLYGFRNPVVIKITNPKTPIRSKMSPNI